MGLPNKIETSELSIKDTADHINSLKKKSEYYDPSDDKAPTLFVHSWQIKKKLIDQGIPANKIYILDSDEVL